MEFAQQALRILHIMSSRLLLSKVKDGPQMTPVQPAAVPILGKVRIWSTESVDFRGWWST